jgi:5-methylcytosine-specific restriction endonuclease McrA
MPSKIQSATSQASTTIPQAESKSSFELRRESSCKRGYGRRWEKLRKMVLARDPLCMIKENLLAWIEANRSNLCGSYVRELFSHAEKLCDGMNPSTQADHKVPRAAGGDDSMENLQGGCDHCHSYKTAVFDSAFARRGRGGVFPFDRPGADRRAANARVTAK